MAGRWRNARNSRAENKKKTEIPLIQWRNIHKERSQCDLFKYTDWKWKELSREFNGIQKIKQTHQQRQK